MLRRRKNFSKMKSKNSSSNKKNAAPLIIAMVVGLVALILLSWTSSTKQNEGLSMGLGSSKLQSKAASSSNDIQQGVVGGVPYLRCGGIPQTVSIDLVLLHGARFAKEDWRTSGILEKLCVHFAVTALDLDKAAGHMELKHVLDAMKADSLLSTTKLPAIVTPSASGKTIVDWLDNVTELEQYVGKWIPVAPPSVGKATEDQLKQLAAVLPILAIYGDKDIGGKIVSDKLGRFSQAKVIEIAGSHPCYLDSPDEFIRHVSASLV